MPDLFADPVTARLNKALTAIHKVGPHGFIHGWIYVGTDGSKISDLDHEKIGSHFGSEAGDEIKKAKDAAAAGDHDGAISHLDKADRAIADHIDAKRRSGEETPEGQYDHEDLLNTMRANRQHEVFTAENQSRAASGHHGLFHRS